MTCGLGKVPIVSTDLRNRVLQGPMPSDLYKKTMEQTLDNITAWCICDGSDRAYSVGISSSNRLALCSSQKGAPSMALYGQVNESDLKSSGYNVMQKRWDYGQVICGKKVKNISDLPDSDQYSSSKIDKDEKSIWCGCISTKTAYLISKDELSYVIQCYGDSREVMIGSSSDIAKIGWRIHPTH